MRRWVCSILVILAASTAAAASSFFLDQDGTLWSASSTSQGLVLVGERGGQTVVQSSVPFGVGLAGTTDTDIQVAADELTGKVAVVWQRNWTADVSEIMLAVWQSGGWERIEHLTKDLSSQPRFPLIQLSEASSTTSEPANSSSALTVSDSFLTVVWWEAGTANPHASLASLRLTAPIDDANALVVHDLDEFAALGLACASAPPESVLEHPLFASQMDHGRVMVLFGSTHLCLFQLLEIQYALDTGAAGGSSMTASTQRGRHIPIFGVLKSFPMIQDVNMEDLRVVLGVSLLPVAYRVNGNSIDYLTCNDQGWSPQRTLAVANGLTLDQAIPLVENLAR